MSGATFVVVHGAVARGTARAGSKLNLIVVAASELPFKERQDYFRGKFKGREPVEMVVYTPAEFNRAKEESTLVQHAMREGRVVYSPERG
jgi:predicted nucleotidyltransferase